MNRFNWKTIEFMFAPFWCATSEHMEQAVVQGVIIMLCCSVLVVSYFMHDYFVLYMCLCMIHTRLSRLWQYFPWNVNSINAEKSRVHFVRASASADEKKQQKKIEKLKIKFIFVSGNLCYR